MRSSRLLSILLLLQNRGRTTAQTLAEEFEVSVRTIYRDIDELSAAGVPVYADRGRAGGFRLMDHYETRLTGLTPSEAEALFLTGLPGPAAELGLREAVATTQLKLLAALPGDRRTDATRVASRFHLDPADWYRRRESTEHLTEIAAAVWNDQEIRIRYESWTGTREQELEPLGLVLKAGVWYLVARARAIIRTYRVSNIQAFALAGRSFVRPESFNLAAHWELSLQELQDRLHRGTAKLRLSPEGMKRLPEIASAAADMAARTAGPADRAGWVEAKIPIESIEHAAREMLKLGPHAEVLLPVELRERMARIVCDLRNLYAS